MSSKSTTGHHADDLAEVAWRTSSYSNGGEQCVEVADLPGRSVAVRDSKDREGPALRFTEAGWSSFIDGLVRSEAFDARAADC